MSDGSAPANKKDGYGRRWARDEQFWRSIATQTLSALLALIIWSFLTYIFLTLTGFLAGPIQWVPVVIVSFYLMFFVSIFVFALNSLNEFTTRRHARGGFAYGAAAVTMLLLMVFFTWWTFYRQ